MYIYENQNWANFTWDKNIILDLLFKIKEKRAFLLGKMSSLGFDIKEKALLNILTEDVIKSSEIEGQKLNTEQVRSSIARKLGINIGGDIFVERDVEGIVEMMLDATQNYNKEITKDRLCGWQSAMFPGGFSGLYKIKTGDYRDDKNGPMQVVSGSIGKEKVHFEAPAAAVLDEKMNKLIDYINNDDKTDLIIKAAITHLWFVIVHPFEDGNGRIARALTDMLLARSENSSNRFYSMSSQIKHVKKSYYKALEITQQSSLDITPWLQWFLENLLLAIDNSEELLKSVFKKAEFWNTHKDIIFSKRQSDILNSFMDDFKGNLTTKKWAKMGNCSHDTATRDIADLIEKGILIKQGEARATHYVMK